MKIGSKVHDGRPYVFVDRPAAAAVLAIRDNYVLLVEQFRPTLGHSLLELPAGKVDQGEAPSEAARRELKEETGYSARLWENLGWYYPSGGYTNEIIHLFRATHLEAGKAQPDEGEDIVTMWYPIGELRRMMARGIINDSKILVALGRLAER